MHMHIFCQKKCAYAHFKFFQTDDWVKLWTDYALLSHYKLYLHKKKIDQKPQIKFLTKKNFFDQFFFQQKNPKKFLTKKIFFDQIFFFNKNPQKIFWPKKNFFLPKNYWTEKKKLSKKTKKHQLCWNIDLIETSTVPASDILWGPLNIDRTA